MKTVRDLPRFLPTLSGIILSIASCPAIAADISAFEIDAKTTGVIISGAITRGDAARFRNVAPLNKRVVTMLDSEGGVLPEALEIGEYIRSKGFSTVVINGARCNSACALIWLAGDPPGISRSAEVGFHAAYMLEEGGSARESGVANALVGRYLTLLNLPKSAVLFATTAPPDKLNLLTAFNFEAVGIKAKVIQDFDFEPNAKTTETASTASGEETQVWKNVGIWTIGVDHTLEGNCFIRAYFEGDTIFRIGIKDIDDGQFYVTLQNPKWKSLKTGQKYQIGMQFDRLEGWDVPTLASTFEDLPALIGQFSDKEFWVEFIRANALRVTADGRSVVTLSLAGSSAAFEELGRCQRYQNSRRAASDPFAK